MRYSILAGSLFGTQIRIHATLLLLLAWVFLDEAMASTWEAAAHSVMFLVLVFGCVLSHEFGHVLAARHFGILTPDILLLPIGGMAHLAKIPERPRQEICVALAGPAVSAVLGATFWATTGFENLLLHRDPPEPEHFLTMLSMVNFGLLVFNLLPAFPMDGGRVLRACLALKFPYLQATEWAASIGQWIALGLFAAGLMVPLPMLSVLAAFIYLSARRETQAVSQRQSGQFGASPTPPPSGEERPG
jgi:Zn-dependent protease